jgi:class 3 adenylate cyclase
MEPEGAVMTLDVPRAAAEAPTGETAMKRQLVACLHADVSGYSQLIAEDVEETARVLTSYQNMIGGLVATHGGRVINVAADSLLAAFATVPPAVRCAVEIQRQVFARNAGLPPHRRLPFRVGIEFGEVLVDSGQLYGECVNVATRVQEIASPGRICLTESAFDRVAPLLLPCDYLGERSVKNIERPIRVYQVRGA